MRRSSHEEAALAQRLGDEPHRPALQIANAAVDQAGGPSRRSGREVVPLDQRHGQAARRRIERHAGPDDPAADDKDVHLAVCHGLEVPGAGLGRQLQHREQW
jgi:hypothetical protein